MFNSSAAPGRHKIISKLSIMFNTTLNNDSITFRFLEYVLWFRSDKKSQKFPPRDVFRLGFPVSILTYSRIRILWSIWIWSSDFLPASQLWIQTLRVTNSTSSKSHSPESGFSKRKIASAKKETPKIGRKSETTKNKFPKVVSEISERLFDFRIRNTWKCRGNKSIAKLNIET